MFFKRWRRSKEGSGSFLKKRTKKLLNALRGLERAPGLGLTPTGKSFLVLFFKKELLPSLDVSCPTLTS
jgi:hypothetical protein